MTTTSDLHAQAETFLRNEHKALRFVLSGDDPWEAFEPARVLAHPEGRAAVAAVGAIARAARWNNEPDGSSRFQLFLGTPIERTIIEQDIGADLVERLVDCSALLRDARSDRWNLAFGLMALGGVIGLAPRDGNRADLVYVGPEALWMEAWRSRLALLPARVADLGCGAGHLSMAIAQGSGAHVVAADLSARAVAASALALALNPHLTGKVSTIRADLAGGLVPGTFDLVTANPPWVPVRQNDHDAGRLFADGGPTGCELPLRFFAAGMELLGPGGTLLMTTLDPTLAGGRRPLVEGLRATAPDEGGVTVERFVTPYRAGQPRFETRFLARRPELVDAEHVLVVATREDGPPGPGHLPWPERLAGALEGFVDSGWRRATN